MARPEIESRVRDVIARTFHIDARAGGRDPRMGEPREWDSMGHMDLIVNLETEFSCRIPTHTIGVLTSVSEIVEFVASLPRKHA
ncbi:MAG TPA: acyl carrier protein [Planctomycetota bacterium]|nr:acyl carrier protein [Planctomycetota bacterium]